MSLRRKPPPPHASTNGGIDSVSPESIPTMRPFSPPQQPPWLPTPLETLILVGYPATLLLGSVFSLLDPASRRSTYSVAAQSYPPEAAPSFFAHKTNPFNVYFVKLGWFWTTLALFAFALTHPRLGPTGAAWALTPQRAQAAARWAVATMCWAATTQWFFGPALIDRGFSLTGGVCRLAKAEGSEVGARIWSSRACKEAGGRWLGGHDISGHVFILILSSGMLLFEALPVVLRSVGGLAAERVVAGEGGRPAYVEDVETMPTGPGAEKTSSHGKLEGLSRWTTLFLLAVAGLQWLMLFMTAAYFHTWFEKCSGLLVSLGALWTVYLLPRAVAPVRSVLGMPGV